MESGCLLVSQASRLYRGINSMRLPAEFLGKDEERLLVCGGREAGPRRPRLVSAAASAANLLGPGPTQGQSVPSASGGRHRPDCFMRLCCARPGVEYGFMSMSSNRDAALSYATEKTPSILFEVQQGLIDRGAEIGWISQYPRGSRLTCWLIVAAPAPRICVAHSCFFPPHQAREGDTVPSALWTRRDLQ